MRTALTACCLLIALVFPTRVQAIWGQLGLGMSSDVYSIAELDGQLIVGGAFTQAGGVPASCIAKWDGASWSPVGAGVGGVSDPRVFALIVYNGDLIAGGHFDEAGLGTASNIARWDGTAWSPLGTGVSGTVYALAVYDGALIAGGDFIFAGNTQVNCIARWDGATWSGLGTGLECESCGNDHTVLSLGVHAGDALVAGGWFNIAGGDSANYIASWNGSWSPLGSGVDYPVSALIDYNGDLIAGGAFSHAGGQAATGIARWDGTSWSPLGQGVVGWYNWVRALTIYNEQLVAGGFFVEAGGEPASHIARWDGGTWSPLGEGTDGSVASLGVSGGRLVVGGSFDWAGSVNAHRIARWDDLAFGACCQFDGACEMTTEADCQPSRIWQGENTACAPNPCVAGACCIYLVCEIHTPTDCAARGGIYEGNGHLCEPDPCPTSSVEGESQIPTTLALRAAPNPTAGEIVIRYGLPVATKVELEIFRTDGSSVRRFMEGARPAGSHALHWDGRDDSNRRLPSGVYHARITTTEGTATARLVVTK